MTDTNVLDKVRKLLRLSTANTNAEEAAAAAAMAQTLLDRHQLDAALLALDDSAPTPSLDEPIQNFTDSPLDKGEGKNLERWRGSLAMHIAKWNACKVWKSGANLMIIGRPSDAETVRYLFAWLAREVEQLATSHGNGQGRTWRNNFRIGVVETIGKKLAEQHVAFETAVRAEAAIGNSQALVRINNALAKVEQRALSVERWTKQNIKLRAGSASRTTYDSGARAAGRAAGQSIHLGTRPGLSNGARRLN